MPRYLLVESALEGRRVLEVGTTDPRSLVRLLDAGATRVTGATPNASDFDRSRFSSHAVELFSMDRGRIDFADDAFDAVLVVDLAAEIGRNARFLDEVRRVLSPRGFVLAGFAASGRSLTHLVSDDDDLPALEPARMEEAVREVFPDARFYVQSPFIGVTIHREDQDPSMLDVSLDPSLSGVESRPSHILALGGPGAPDPGDRTLVELPFLDFETLTEASQARSAADLKRLLGALAEARRAIGQRDQSLKEIAQRLPKIKAAFQEKLERARSSVTPNEVISPTVLERPTDDGTPQRLTEAVSRLESLRQDLSTRVDGLSAALEREKSARLVAEARVAELEDSGLDGGISAPTIIGDSRDEEQHRQLEALHQEVEHQNNVIRDLRSELEARERDTSRFQTRIGELQQTIFEQTSVQPIESDEAVADAERRIRHLERTASAKEQRVAELEHELSSQLEVRHSLGTDYRDAEARIEYLSRRIDDMALAHTEERDRLEERAVFLAAALSESDHERERLQDVAAALEANEEALTDAQDRAERRAEEAIRAYAEASQMSRGLADEVDQLRREAHQRAGRIDALERELADRMAQIAVVSGSAAARDVDRIAVEMAAGHLSREVDQLRRRVQELRNERDTLAATSQLLLEERDAAAELAHRAIASEHRAQQLAESLEGGQAAIERLEREVDDARDAAETAHQRHLELLERNKKLEGQLQALTGRMADATNMGSAQGTRVSELDQKLAELGRRLAASVEERDRAVQAKEELEDLLRETSMAASDAVREARIWRDRNDALERDAKAHLDHMGTALAQKVRAEQEGAEAVWALTHAEAERALYRADLAMLRKQVVLERAAMASQPVDRGEVDQALAAKQTAETALGRTLEEAAKLSMRLSDVERELEVANGQIAKLESEKVVIDRSRMGAEERAKSAEAARAHEVMESKAFADRVKRLELEQTALIRELEARENDVLRLEAAARKPVPAPAPVEVRSDTVDDDLEILVARAAADATAMDRLRLDRFSLQERIEALESALAIAVANPNGAEASLFAERSRRMDAEDALHALRAAFAAIDDTLPSVYVDAATDTDSSESAESTRRELEALVRQSQFESRAQIDELLGRLDLARLRIGELEDQVGMLVDERYALYEQLRLSNADTDRARAAIGVQTRLAQVEERLELAHHQHAIVSDLAVRLERQRDEARAETDAIRSELEVTVSARGAEAEAERAQLVHEIESLARAKNDAIAERSTLEGLLQALAEQQQGADREREALAQQLQVVTEARDQLSLQLADHAQDAEVESTRNAELEDRVTELDGERTRLESRLNELQADLANRVGELQDERSDLVSRIDALHAERNDAQARAASASHAVTKLSARIEAIEEERAEAVAARDALEARTQIESTERDATISTLRDRVEQLDAERVSTADERAALEARLHALTEERQEIEASVEFTGQERDQARAERAALADDVSRLEAEVQTVRAEFERAQSDLKSLEQAYASLESAQATATRGLERATRDLEAARQEIATLRPERDEAQGLAKAADEELSAAIARLEATSSERDRLRMSLTEAEDELTEARAARELLDHQHHELAQLRLALEGATQSKASLESRISELTRAVEIEAERFAETTGERDTLRAIVEAAKLEQDELRASIQSLEEQINEQQLAAQERVARLAQTAGERDGLKAEVGEIRQQLEAERQRADEGWQQAQALDEARAGLEAALADADPTELRRAMARAQEAELRAERAEASATRLEREHDESKLLLAQIEERRSEAESRTTRLEAQLEKERADAQRASDRARHAEAFSKESEARARELESKRKTLESRSLEAEGRAEHAERRRRQLELEVQQVQSRLESRAQEAEAQARVAEERRTELEGERSKLELRIAAMERELGGQSRIELEEALATANLRLTELESSAGASEEIDGLRARTKNLERALADRDGEVKRLRALADRAARELDEARAEVGRKLSEIRQGREGLEFVRRQLTQARSDSDVLRAKLDRSGDAAELRGDIETRDQQLARLTAEATALESERHRLRSQLTTSQEAQAQLEIRIAELEMGMDDRDRRLDVLTRELADKTDRLRRLAGLPET